MAISYDGPNGGFVGKVGSIVGYRSRGQWIIRGLPKKSAKMKRGSEAQNLYRARLREVNGFLRPLLPFIQLGFKQEAEAKNSHAYNQAKSHNLKHAYNEANQFEMSRLKLSSGGLPLPGEIKMEWVEDGILISWSNEEANWDRWYDQLMVGMYTKEQGGFALRCSSHRKDCSELFPFPQSDRNQSFHTWVAFIDHERTQCTNSHYLQLISETES